MFSFKPQDFAKRPAETWSRLCGTICGGSTAGFTSAFTLGRGQLVLFFAKLVAWFLLACIICIGIYLVNSRNRVSEHAAEANPMRTNLFCLFAVVMSGFVIMIVPNEMFPAEWQDATFEAAPAQSDKPDTPEVSPEPTEPSEPVGNVPTGEATEATPQQGMDTEPDTLSSSSLAIPVRPSGASGAPTRKAPPTVGSSTLPPPVERSVPLSPPPPPPPPPDPIRPTSVPTGEQSLGVLVGQYRSTDPQ